MRFERYFVLPLLLLSAGCGGAKGPTAASDVPVGATRANIVVNAMDVTGQKSITGPGYLYGITVHLQEGAGVGATFSGATLTFSSNGSAIGTVTYGADAFSSLRIEANGVLASKRLLITDANTSHPFATSVQVAVTFSDDHGTSGSVNRTADIPPLAATPAAPSTFRLSGLMQNDQTSKPLNGASVKITSGSNAGKSAVADNLGQYRLEGLAAGSLVVQFEVDGFETLTKSVNLSSDVTLDVRLRPSAPTSPPPPANPPTPPPPSAPNVEYRVIGSGGATEGFMTFSNSSEGTSQVDANLPWSYKFSGAQSGQFLYISAQNQQDHGTITVQIYKRGVLYKSSTSTGQYVIAEADGEY